MNNRFTSLAAIAILTLVALTGCSTPTPSPSTTPNAVNEQERWQDKLAALQQLDRPTLLCGDLYVPADITVFGEVTQPAKHLSSNDFTFSYEPAVTPSYEVVNDTANGLQDTLEGCALLDTEPTYVARDTVHVEIQGDNAAEVLEYRLTRDSETIGPRETITDAFDGDVSEASDADLARLNKIAEQIITAAQ